MTKQAYEKYLSQLRGYKFDGTPESHQKGLELYEQCKQTSRRGYWRGNKFRRFKRHKRFGHILEQMLHRLAELLQYDLVNNKITFEKPKVVKPVAKVEKKKRNQRKVSPTKAKKKPSNEK